MFVPYVEAIASSILINSALVVQAIDARAAPADLGMKPGLFMHLMRRKLWMLGNAMNVASAILQVLALEHLSVAVVQSIAAGGILCVPLSAQWILRERPSRRDVLAMAVIVFGLALAMATTPPQDAVLAVSPWLVFGATAALAALGFVAARRNIGTILVAGVCFGAATVVMKVLSLGGGLVLSAVSIALLGISGGIGFLTQTTALQTTSPTRVAPLVLAVSTALPILVAPWLFAEHWPAPHLTLFATLLVIVAAGWLAAKPIPVPALVKA